MVKSNLREVLKKLVLYLIAFLSLVYTLYPNDTPIILIGLILFYLLISSPEDDLYLYALLIPFYFLLVVQDRNITFIFLLISTVKILFTYHKRTISLVLLSLGMSLLGIEIFNDFMRVPIGEFAYVISGLLFFIVVLVYNKVLNIDIKKLHKSAMIGYLMAIITTLFYAYINNQLFDLRLGTDLEIIGGAMGIPVYSILLIIYIYTSLISSSRFKIFNSIFLVLVVLVGFLTYSRSFLLGLIPVVIIMFFNLMSLSKKTKIIILLLPVIIITTYFLRDYLLQAIRNINLRNEQLEDFSSGRIDIYKSVIVYQFNSIRSMFFGLGIKNYSLIGETHNYEFRALAHNIILDIWISIGLVGFFLFFLFVYLSISKSKPTKDKFMMYLPALSLFFIYQTAGTLSLIYTYVYIILYLIYPLGRERLL